MHGSNPANVFGVFFFIVVKSVKSRGIRVKVYLTCAKSRICAVLVFKSEVSAYNILKITRKVIVFHV